MGHAPQDARELTDFERAVKKVVASIPCGTVLAYGEVALLAGRPGGARAVVKALHRLGDVPWWRVVRADRTLAEEIASEQRPRLEAEGVVLKGRRILRTRHKRR
ncbi:MAG: MGMT family protein [Myxococcaceae bacterium]